VRGRTLIAGAAVAALALVVTSLALGGASYHPRPVADPCQPRAWRSTSNLDELTQQLASSALDGAACELHVSRETLALALASPAGRQRFIDNPRLGAALRAGLVRAIDDAGRAGAIPAPLAGGLSAVAQRLPADQVVAAVRGAGGLLGGAGGLLGPLTQLFNGL
jgi:hypothetical protein